MNKITINKIIPFLILLALSGQYLLLSMELNDIFTLIVGDQLTIFGLVKSLNNLVYSLIPVLFFAYIYITTKIMLSVFEITINNNTLASIILFGMSVPLIGICFYTINFMFYRTGEVSSSADIQNLSFLFGLHIADFKLINDLCWVMLYVILFLFLCIKEKISILKSVAICASPSILVFLFNLLFKNC